MIPLKYWPIVLSAPMKSGCIEVVSDAVTGALATMVPLTYKRIIAPSKVRARWVHVFTGKGDGAKTICFPSVKIPPASSS